MRMILKLVFISILATGVGCLPLLFGTLINGLITNGSIDLRNLTLSIGFYLFIVSVISIGVFFIGSTLYLSLLRLKLANYATSILLGCLTFICNAYDSLWVFVTTSGLLIGPLFHFYFNKYKVSFNQNITSS
jgi:hypothetical protein